MLPSPFVGQGVIVSCRDAERLLQEALAATVIWSSLATGCVVMVSDALAAPSGTLSGPVQAGEPVHPENVASFVPESSPSLSRTDTVELASLASTMRLRLTVAVSELPPPTVDGMSASESIASAGGVTVTFLVSGDPAPVVAETVAAMLEVAVLVAVKVPEVVLVVQPTGMVKLPLVTNALDGLLVTVTLTPPTGAGTDSVPRVNALVPPGIVAMSVPPPSVMRNEASGGTVIEPPAVSVRLIGTDTRLRDLPAESVNEVSTASGAVVVEATVPVGSTQLTEVMFDISSNGTLHSGGTSGVVPSRLTTANGECDWVSVAVIVTLPPPGRLLVENDSGAAPVKQASLAWGDEVLRVTGVLLDPVRQAIEQVCDSVQLFIVPRAPPVQEYSSPLLQLSLTDPPQTTPLYGHPAMFCAVHVWTIASTATPAPGCSGPASSSHPGAARIRAARTSMGRATHTRATGLLAKRPEIDRVMVSPVMFDMQ
jgi:hypothetical protein